MTQELNFQVLFEALPHLVLVLSRGPDFIMVAANEGRLRGTNTRREDCIGRSIFEVFGNNPDELSEFGTGVLRASLERVMRTRRPDRMAITKYDIPRPTGEGAASRCVTGAPSIHQYSMTEERSSTSFTRPKMSPSRSSSSNAPIPT